MDKDKLDKTKENIGVTKLDDKTRKKLFEKFVESGGKIVDEKSMRRRLTIDREKQKQYLKRTDGPPDKKVKKEKQDSEDYKPPIMRKAPPRSDAGSLTLAFGRMKMRLRLKFLGVTGLNGYFFSNRFFRKFNNTYKPALMEIQILYLEIFRKNPSVGRTITAKLDAMKPLYYELIEMVGNIFDKIMSDQIIEQYVNFPEVAKKVPELKEPVLFLHRKLYILNPFENSILMAFEQAIDLYLKTEENVGDSHFAMTRRMRNAVFVIFHKFYPRLHLLFCLYQGRYYQEYDPAIEAILGLTDIEKPGTRQLIQYFHEVAASVSPAERESTEETEVHNETEETRARAIRLGLEIMSKLDMVKLRKEYDKARLFENVSDADKVFITYLLFNEFDREYSFILTTNKIKFRTDFIARTKIDFRAKLNDLYDKMRKSSDSLREYADELVNYEKARREKPSGSSQYIEYTKRLEALEKKKNATGKNALAIVREYMYEIALELQVLLEDMDSQQLYIENPQEVLVFDPLIEGEKKINGRKIYEALYTVYSFAMAFAYRLNSSGDLSGELEFRRDEMDHMHKQMQERAAASQEGSDDKSKKSVLEELDDMI